MVKEWLSAGIAHVEVIVGPSKLMNEQSPIPLLLTKLAKKNDRVTVNNAACLGRLIPLFWMLLCSSMMLVPFFWMIKFSGVLHECKEELMIVNGNGSKTTIKGGGSVWKEWARLQFQCRGVINLDFLIDREGSMVWLT